MQTNKLNELFDFADTKTETAVELSSEDIAALHRAAELHDLGHILLASPHGRPRRSGIWGNIGRWILSVSAATTPMPYVDLRHELRRSGASSTIWTLREKRGRPISLHEVWHQVARVLAEAERRRALAREFEAREFMWSFVDEDL